MYICKESIDRFLIIWKLKNYVINCSYKCKWTLPLMLLFPINRFSSQISIFLHFWQFHIYHDALTFIKCLIPFFISFYGLLVFNGYSFLLYYNFSYGQALKVNWAYTNNQREDTSGYFRLPFFFILLIDFVAC